MARPDKPQPRRSGRDTGIEPSRKNEIVLKDRALDASAEGITIADSRLPDQPLIYVNEGFERLTGYSAEYVRGRNCRFLQGPDTDPSTVDEIHRAVNEGRECVVEILNYHKSGAPFWNRLSITPITDDAGHVTHFIGVQSDITARKNAEDRLHEAYAQLAEANRRINQDIEIAAEIQHGFLPDKGLRVEGVKFAWDLRSCDELGGDTLNVVPLDDRYVELYTIDVSGHGVPAALLSVTLNHFLTPSGGRMTLSERWWEPGHKGAVSPADMATILNRQFPYDAERNQFFTLVYGIYDTQQRLFRFITAGHPPPIYVSRSGGTRLDFAAGPPIGLSPDIAYKQNALQLSPGDRVYLYSDGVIEVDDDKAEPFGFDRLTQILEDARHKPIEAAVGSVIKEVERWGRNAPFEDDVSILAFEAE